MLLIHNFLCVGKKDFIHCKNKDFISTIKKDFIYCKKKISLMCKSAQVVRRFTEIVAKKYFRTYLWYKILYNIHIFLPVERLSFIHKYERKYTGRHIHV